MIIGSSAEPQLSTVSREMLSNRSRRINRLRKRPSTVISYPSASPRTALLGYQSQDLHCRLSFPTDPVRSSTEVRGGRT